MVGLAIFAGVLSLAACGTFVLPGPKRTPARGTARIVLIALLILLLAGMALALLAVPLAGTMLVFNDTGVPLNELVGRHIAPMFATLAWLAVASGVALITLLRYSRDRLVAVILIPIGLLLFLISFPEAAAAFDFAVMLAGGGR